MGSHSNITASFDDIDIDSIADFKNFDYCPFPYY